MMNYNRSETSFHPHSHTHHAQYGSSLADGRHKVLIEDLILWWVELL